MIRQRHWPLGPYPVHPGSTDDCWKFWCTIWNRHDWYVDCSCGWNVRAKKVKDAGDAAIEHIAEQRRQLATGGMVHAPDAAIVAALFAQANDCPQHMATEFKKPVAAPAEPAFILEIKLPAMLSQADVELIRQQIRIMRRPKP